MINQQKMKNLRQQENMFDMQEETQLRHQPTAHFGNVQIGNGQSLNLDNLQRLPGVEKRSLLLDEDNRSLINNLTPNSMRRESSVEEINGDVSPRTLQQIKEIEEKDKRNEASQELPREELSNEVRFSSRNELGFIADSIDDEVKFVNGHGEVRGPGGVVYKVIKETDPMPWKEHESAMRKKETELHAIIHYYTMQIEKKMQMCQPVFKHEVQPLEDAMAELESLRDQIYS